MKYLVPVEVKVVVKIGVEASDTNLAFSRASAYWKEHYEGEDKLEPVCGRYTKGSASIDPDQIKSIKEAIFVDGEDVGIDKLNWSE